MRPDSVHSRAGLLAHRPGPPDEPPGPVRIKDHLQLLRIESPGQRTLPQRPQPRLELGYLVIRGDLH